MHAAPRQRKAITIHGVVQGVGFRPFVYRLASQLQLQGFVRNHSGGVQMEIEGERSAIEQFLVALQNHPPTLSRIDRLQCRSLPVTHETGFRIEDSERERSSQISLSPDIATCAACLQDLFDPADRRYRYPFLNCTNCGPRLTIIQSAPYDRERTTMSGFPMCPACRAEYDDPQNRRFHAQPTACPVCGPRLTALHPSGETMGTTDPLNVFLSAVLDGQIGAMKGIGGFHLVCDARNERAVAELRRRKHRDEKPFAVMVPDTETALVYCEMNSQERELLESRRRPIVLLRKRSVDAATGNPIANAAAPENPELGVMLPYSPLHSLLMDAAGKVPLVMTSGNRSDEPMAYQNETALEQLGPLADVFLSHDRPIHVRCEDSVFRVMGGQQMPLRRSRGYAPEPIPLPWECPRPLLAVGGQLKNVFALGKGRQAILSHHLGDLDHFAAYQAFERDIQLYEQLFDITPELIVHDLHPNYTSTCFAKQYAVENKIPLLGVQHHHAHLASLMAEHGLEGPLIGVTFDGGGYGTDGTVWGGEFLVGDYRGFTRKTHFRPVRLPGGEQAIREPWRMALAHLYDADCAAVPVANISSTHRRTIERMIERGVNSPYTSSAGRLFDAVAALAGVRTHVSYEGQAAMQWEWLATDVPEAGRYPFEVAETIDTRPLIRSVVQDVRQAVPAPIIARRFHSTMVEIIIAVCQRIRSATGLDAVGLSGGVFLNALLTCETSERLQAAGFRVYQHRLVPPGDGGLSLGQLAIAAKSLIDQQELTTGPPLAAALKEKMSCALEFPAE